MKHAKLVYAAQGVAGAILLAASVMKFIDDPASIAVFESLNMEPGGRYIIGVIELFAALLLLSPYAVFGAIMAVSVMCGAIIAHTTKLGIVVNDDNGLMASLLVVVFLCSGYVLFSRRKELPVVGDTL